MIIIPSIWSKCYIEASELNILRSSLMTTMINLKYFLKMFYSTSKSEYTEVMSYDNHDQYKVLAPNVLFKHRNWISWCHVLWQPWLLSQVYLLEMFYWSIEIEYTDFMFYNNHHQSQVFAQNVIFKHRNWMYWGHVWWQPWSIPSACSKSSILSSKLNILRSCLMTTMINHK